MFNTKMDQDLERIFLYIVSTNPGNSPTTFSNETNYFNKGLNFVGCDFMVLSSIHIKLKK